MFFDNLQIVQTRSPVLEACPTWRKNHYYSYGLKIAAISSKAAGALQNSYLYQGDFSEYDEESGYNEFYLRHYDAQIARWTTTDPYEQFASPYLGMGNSPGGMVDPDGGEVLDWIKWIDKDLTTQVTWFDDPSKAADIINGWGGEFIENLGLSGFWRSNQFGNQNWWLNADGTAVPALARYLSIPTHMPLRAPDMLKEIPAPKPGFWQSFNIVANSPFSNPGSRFVSNFVFGIANDAYILGQDYAQGHRGAIRDLNDEYVTARQRQNAGMNTFQLFMAQSTFAVGGTMSAAKQVLNPKEINFMQSSIKNVTGEFTVLGNAQALKSGALNPEVLRMNVWKDASGKIWTLDHRRLAAFRLSGLQEAPIQWANPSGQMWKMTTTNGGSSIWLKFGRGNGVTVR